MRLPIWIFLTAALLCAPFVCAQEPASIFAPPKKSVQPVKTATPPVIDGKLDDEVWKQSEEYTGFVDTRLEKLDDDEFVYFSFVIYQDKETINANIFKYDRIQLRFEDYIQIGLDTFHDQQSAYIFLVSPIGTRWDSRDGVFGRNQSWDARWDAKTTIYEDRWEAEVAIPIGVMYLNREADTTWGFNIRRRFSQKNDSSHWNYDPEGGVPRRAVGPKFVADFGLMNGLDLSNVKIQRDPRVETDVSTTVSKREGGDLHTNFGAGLDLDMRINSHWTAQYTANPDFGEIAADEGDVQNRDTARFLPERRSFFNEGAELFRTPVNIYDSRNFVDITTAAKITGTGEDWSLASLVLRGEGARSGPDTNFVVARYTDTVTDDLQVGLMTIHADRDVGFNNVTGADTRYELSSTTTWNTQYLYMTGEEEQKSSEQPGVTELDDVSAHGFNTALEGGTLPFFWNVDFRDISKNFNPDLGFIPRRDVIGPTVELNYNENYDGDILEGLFGQFQYKYYEGHDGTTKLRDYFWMAGVNFQNDWDFFASIRDNFHDPFNNTTNSIFTTYKRQDRFKSWRGGYSWGEFQTIPFNQYFISKPFQFNSRWTNDLTSTIRQEDIASGTRNVWIWRVVSEYTFLWEGRLKLTLEATSDRSYARTLLFAYEDLGDWDFFLVINDFRTPVSQNVDLGLEAREDVLRSIFAKFVYRW
jgi:Domain of unknown function (DUF5916)